MNNNLSESIFRHVENLKKQDISKSKNLTAKDNFINSNMYKLLSTSEMYIPSSSKLYFNGEFIEETKDKT